MEHGPIREDGAGWGGIVTLSILLFFYLFGYGIKILGVPIGVVLGLLSLAWIFLAGQTAKFIRFWKQELALLLLLLFLQLNVDAFIGPGLTSQSFSVYLLRIFLDGLMPAFLLGLLFRRLQVSLDGLLHILVGLCYVQFIAALLMLALPSVKNFYMYQLLQIDTQFVMMNDYLSLFRGFGFAYSFYSWFPYALGLILVMVAWGDCLRSVTAMTLLAFAIIVVIAVNARVGFVPVLLGVGITFLAGTRVRIIKNLLLLLAIVALIVLSLSLVHWGPETEARFSYLKSWILDEGFLSFFKEKGSHTIQDLKNYQIFSEFNFLDYLFGRGELLVPKNEKIYNDVGYIQTLYSGGILLSLGLYVFFFRNVIRLRKLLRDASLGSGIPKNMKFLPLLFGLSLFLGHYKLRIFEINEATKLLFLLVCFFGISTKDVEPIKAPIGPVLNGAG